MSNKRTFKNELLLGLIFLSLSAFRCDGEDPTPDNQCSTVICEQDCESLITIDNTGCEICECAPVEIICPVYRCKACDFGYIVDEDGCNTCGCLEGEDIKCSIIGESTCPEGQHCEEAPLIPVEPGTVSPRRPAPTGVCTDNTAGISCYSTQECGFGEICTVDLGVCNAPPSTGGDFVPAVCTGSCVEEEEAPFCIQVQQAAISLNGVCVVFPTPCDVPDTWEKVTNCASTE